MSLTFREGEAASAAKVTEVANSLLGGPSAGFHRQRGQISPASEPALTARITGGSGPYSWTEAVYIPGAGWVDGPASGASDAREINGQTVATDKRVRLYPNPVEGWDFQFLRHRAPTPCPSPTTLIVEVNGCHGLPLPGATVTISKGSFTATETTDSSGNATFDLNDDMDAGAGTYSVEISHPRFVTQNHSVVVVCGSTGGGVWDGAVFGDPNGDFTLTPSSGYHCGCTTCPLPYADTIYLSTWLGTCSLTWSAGDWVGTQVWRPSNAGHTYCGSECPGQEAYAYLSNFYEDDVTITWTLQDGCFLEASINWGVGDGCSSSITVYPQADSASGCGRPAPPSLPCVDPNYLSPSIDCLTAARSGTYTKSACICPPGSPPIYCNQIMFTTSFTISE